MTAVIETPVVAESTAPTGSKNVEITINCRATFMVTSALDRANFYRALRNYLGSDFVRVQDGCLRLSEYTKRLWTALQRRVSVDGCEVAMVCTAEDSFSRLSNYVGVELPEVCAGFLHTKAAANPEERVVLRFRGKQLVFEQGDVDA